MNILLQNPAILLVIVVFVARLIGKRMIAGKKNAAEATPSVEESERTRRVREEVARKIAERRGEMAPPVRPAARSVLSTAAADEDRRAIARVQRTTAGTPDPEIAEVLAEQQRMAAHVRLLEQARALARASAAPAPLAARVVPASGPAYSSLPELRDPHSARRAMILREVLGSPRGLTLEGCLWKS